MNALDPRSLIVMGCFNALVMAVVLGFMRRHYPPSIQGLGYWAWMPVVWLTGGLMFAMPENEWFDVVRQVGNAFIIGGMALFHIGCRRFFAQPSAWQRVMAAWTLSMLALAWFTWVSPSYPTRAALITLAILYFHAMTLWFLWRHGSRNFPVRMVQTTLLVHFAVLLVRLQGLFSAEAVADLMDASTVQTFYLGSYVVVVLLLTIAAVLMATDRVRTELEHIASHDALTGTLNRRAILEFCADEHERSLRYGQPFSLMMIDLDHFKAINDTYGHQHGDRVLVHFAKCTRAALRRADRFGRYGGEEFLVLLPNTTVDTARPLTERIRAALATGHALDCKASIGVTHWQGPEDALDAMLARADAAMYRAKAQGRDQTCVG
jgi:diguanylate cyclase (GGDEF)-like protein